MRGRYTEPSAPRHRRKTIDGVEQIRMPIRRNGLLLAFLPLWLAGWTAGGIVAMSQVARAPEAFLIVWLGAWAVGWVFAASLLATQLFGAEVIRVAGGDLEVRKGAGPLARTWRYRGGAIQNLTVHRPAHDLFGLRDVQTPFWMRPRTGAVTFDYGAGSVFLANGVDAPEGREIADWLSKRLAVGTGAGGAPTVRM